MPLFLALVVISVGWLLVTGKVRLNQLPPVLLGLVALLFLGRGEWIGGIAGMGIAAAWFHGINLRYIDKPQHSNESKAIKAARAILGASANDDSEAIRTLHRKLIADNHPDKGGTNLRAAQLNEARDLLLTKLSNPMG